MNSHRDYSPVFSFFVLCVGVSKGLGLLHFLLFIFTTTQLLNYYTQKLSWKLVVQTLVHTPLEYLDLIKTLAE